MRNRFLVAIAVLSVGVSETAYSFSTCSEATRACYDANMTLVTGVAKRLMGIAHEFERAADDVAAGRPIRVRASVNNDLRDARAAFRELHPDTLFRDRAFWGFRYKSAGEMQLKHFRLEQCEIASARARHLAVDMVDGKQQTADFVSDAVSYVLEIEQCEGGVGTPHRASTLRKLGQMALAKCSSINAPWCNIHTDHIEAVLSRSQVSNDDYERLPKRK